MYAGHYNGDKINTAREAWYSANATHIAEHNAKSETFQLGGTQFVDLSQEKYWTTAGLGFKASGDRIITALNFGAHNAGHKLAGHHMYAGHKFAGHYM